MHCMCKQCILKSEKRNLDPVPSKMEENWEDAIEIDDSDLTSLFNPSPPKSISLPPLQPCSLSRPKNLSSSSSSSPRPLIPGPAAAVQAAMRRRSSSVPVLDSQGLQRRQMEDRTSTVVEAEDDDFKMHPWLSAVAFLGKDLDSKRTPIGLIKNPKSAADRVPQVAGVVNSCVPNGLGDLFVTLKDPTGTIGASIHRNFAKESNLACDILVGCVLILKQVVVFCPGRSAFYLNITPKNLVKIINKDCGPPQKQMILSSEARNDASGSVDKLLNSMRQTEESPAHHEVGNHINMEMIIECRKKTRCDNLPHNGTARYATMSLAKPNLSTNNSSSISTKFNTETTTTTDITAKTGPRTNTTANMAGESDLGSNFDKTINATKNMTVETDSTTIGAKKMISRVSVTQWTDEQLLELFADYQDDVELVHHTL